MQMFIHNFFHFYITHIGLALLIGYVLDLAFGDPRNMWHPICFIGNMISWFEKRLRPVWKGKPSGELFGGVLLTICILVCSSGISLVVLMAGYRVHWILCLALQCYMCWTILATRSLKTESMKVYDALVNDGVEAGRYAVSMIVGRDTQSLTDIGVTKAAVETIAENTSDGIIAPMFFMAIGGPVLGYFYKAANTMDSMVGYKNDKFLYFGRAAAKFDDIVNFIPARISALIMILASYFVGFDGKNAARIYKRDRYNHASPNSAQTESVMAGALQVQLAGDAWYFGVKHEKPTIGDPLRAVEYEDIKRANRLLYMTSGMSLVIFLAVRLLVTVLCH